MWRERESRSYVYAFWGTFLFFILLRITLSFIKVTENRPFFLFMTAQIMCVLIVNGWLLTVQNRIINKKIRHQMLAVGSGLLMYYFMQMIKYCLFARVPDICRYMWYSYYIPMTMIPLLIFFILHDLSFPEQESIGLRCALTVAAILICVGFLTNDFHQLAFEIPNWYENEDKGRTLGPVYYVYIVFMGVLLLLGIQRMLHLYRSRKDKKKLIYPAIPLMIGILYLILYTIKSDWTLLGHYRILELSEIFTFMMIGFLEMSIQIGLIPSNMHYEKLFFLTEIPARVLDMAGETVFETLGAQRGFVESEDHHIVARNVKGGRFLYGVDLANINRLNRELDEITADLEAKNELLQHENEIVEERKRPEEAIRIYDSISEIVRPQIMEVHELLSDVEADESQFRTRLVRSAVLNAYIKRRSNMELEAQKNGVLSFRELISATAESMEYFKLSGADTFLSASGEGRYPAGEIIRAYQAFEAVMETILGGVEYMTVRLTSEDTICFRFLISGKQGMPQLSGLRIDGCDLEYEAEENDTKLVIRIRKGGEVR